MQDSTQQRSSGEKALLLVGKVSDRSLN